MNSSSIGLEITTHSTISTNNLKDGAFNAHFEMSLDNHSNKVYVMFVLCAKLQV